MKSSNFTDKRRGKFRRLITRRGGIFTSKARKRLLGLSPGRPGWSESSADFRHDMREYVKQALIDLELFIETADEKDINRVINVETIEPVINSYFTLDFGPHAERSIFKAELARKMVYDGFYYLRVTQYGNVPDYESKIIDEALDVSKNLAERMTLTIMRNDQETSK